MRLCNPVLYFGFMTFKNWYRTSYVVSYSSALPYSHPKPVHNFPQAVNKKSTTLLPSMVGLRLSLASFSETVLCYGLPAPAGTLSFNLSILMIQFEVNKQLCIDAFGKMSVTNKFGEYKLPLDCYLEALCLFSTDLLST